jgi:hypothetical protein
LSEPGRYTKHDVVEQINLNLAGNARKLDPRIIFTLMEDFI